MARIVSEELRGNMIALLRGIEDGSVAVGRSDGVALPYDAYATVCTALRLASAAEWTDDTATPPSAPHPLEEILAATREHLADLRAILLGYGPPTVRQRVPDEEIGELKLPPREAALRFLREHRAVDGAHHKQWVIAQALLMLSGEQYKFDIPGDLDEGSAP